MNFIIESQRSECSQIVEQLKINDGFSIRIEYMCRAEWLPFSWTGRLSEGVHNLDHIFTLQAIIEEGRCHDKRIYCCFVDFRKAFDTVPRAWLMQRLEALGVPTDMQWGNYALYESKLGKVWSSKGLSKAVASTIGVKQGCPLSPTLFDLYRTIITGHYLANYMARF